MILWRYLSFEYAFQALETGFWKVGRILELNDPMDCRPVVFANPLSTTPEPFDNPTITMLTEGLGVLCFSEHIESPAVWAHYGDSHRGIAFGFEFPQEAGVFPIQYEDRRARLYESQLASVHVNDQARRDNEILQQGFLLKSTSWSFEAEHRQFVSFLNPDVQFKRPHYFAPVPWQHLHHVVHGVRANTTSFDIWRLLESRIGPWPHEFRGISRAVVHPFENKIHVGGGLKIARLD